MFAKPNLMLSSCPRTFQLSCSSIESVNICVMSAYDRLSPAFILRPSSNALEIRQFTTEYCQPSGALLIHDRTSSCFEDIANKRELATVSDKSVASCLCPM